MKLQDKETLSIATAVKDVLEKKTVGQHYKAAAKRMYKMQNSTRATGNIVKEIKYPHKMYSPDGKEVTANNKEEHESYSAKGYSHKKPVEESPDEPVAKGEKEFKAKHAVKKSGATNDGGVVKEGPVIWLDEPDEIQTEAEEEPKEEESDKQKKYQAFFKKALAKFGVKSPAELEGDKKKEFFDYVDKNYKSTNESVITERNKWSWQTRWDAMSKKEKDKYMGPSGKKAVEVLVDFGSYQNASAWANEAMHYMDPYYLNGSTIGLSDIPHNSEGKEAPKEDAPGYRYIPVSGTVEDMTEFFTTNRWPGGLGKPMRRDLSRDSYNQVLKDIKRNKKYTYYQ